jgi:hypothetical protein
VRKKRPDQYRWKVRDVINDPDKQAAFAAEALSRGVLSSITDEVDSLEEPTQAQLTDIHERIVAELKTVPETIVGGVVVPGEKRVRFHHRAVTTVFSEKSQARVKLQKAKAMALRFDSPSSKASLDRAHRRFVRASKNANACIRAAKDKSTARALLECTTPGEVCKKEHQLFKRVTGAARCGSQEHALGDMVTMVPPLAEAGSSPVVARGHAEVGELVSEYTRLVSGEDTKPGEFDDAAAAEVSALVARLNSEAPAHGASDSMSDDLTREEVHAAVKSLEGKLHKSPGLDEITNWMLVWGGAAVVDVLTALYKRVWTSGVMPEVWDEALVNYIHKNSASSRSEISNYRPISLIAVIAKTFTKTLLPRLMGVFQNTQIPEQGACRKGQGSPEHLWAFANLMEEAIGEGPDAKGYALFADVSKAYDQVWRDGLYLALYASGVRGRMWSIIQRWLNCATASTKWNGVRGPSVPLQVGLRQGCVLSPVLYSFFINTFFRTVPLDSEAPPVPAWAVEGVEKFYSHGIHNVSCEEAGIYCSALQRKVNGFLFVDDTTLVARSVDGLRAMIQQYVKYCKVFRMRLNARKSKLMEFTKGSTLPDLEIQVDGMTFDTPKGVVEGSGPNVRIVRRHQYLGVLVDSALNWKGHRKFILAKGNGMRHSVALVATELGEAAALQYLEAAVAPKALFGSEFVHKSDSQAIDQMWFDLLGVALRLGKVQRPDTAFADRDDSMVRKKSLMGETRELPWSIQGQARAAGLYARIRGEEHPASMATAMARHPYSRSSVPCIRDGAVAMGLNADSPRVPGWKRRVKRSAQELAAEQFRVSCSVNVGEAKRSDHLNTAYMPVNRGTYDEWAWALPRSLRIAFRRLRLGMMPGTKTATVRRQQGWKARWGSRDHAFDMTCPCRQAATETGVHVLTDCGCTEYIRRQALVAADAVARNLEGGEGWVDLPDENKMGALCSPLHGVESMSREDFRLVRIRGTRVWVDGMKAYDRRLATQNSSLADEVRHRVQSDAQARRREQRAASAGTASSAPVMSPEVRRAQQGADEAVQRLRTARAALAGRSSSQ